jgi:hypothetical protein
VKTGGCSTQTPPKQLKKETTYMPKHIFNLHANERIFETKLPIRSTPEKKRHNYFGCATSKREPKLLALITFR